MRGHRTSERVLHSVFGRAQLRGPQVFFILLAHSCLITLDLMEHIMLYGM